MLQRMTEFYKESRHNKSQVHLLVGFILIPVIAMIVITIYLVMFEL